MPRSGAERARDCRARRRGGRLLVKLELAPEIHCAALVDGGYLAEWDLDDPAAIARAIVKMLAEAEAVTS
jgi:hypothetical protein